MCVQYLHITAVQTTIVKVNVTVFLLASCPYSNVKPNDQMKLLFKRCCGLLSRPTSETNRQLDDMRDRQASMQ